MNSVTKTLTVELNSGKSFEIEVTAIGMYDSNYGADADGNRGTGVWFIEGFEYTLPETDDEGVKLTIDELHELDIALNKKALNEDWEFSHEDDSEPEEDWDNYNDLPDGEA